MLQKCDICYTEKIIHKLFEYLVTADCPDESLEFFILTFGIKRLTVRCLYGRVKKSVIQPPSSFVSFLSS